MRLRGCQWANRGEQGFWLLQRPHRNRTFPMKRLVKGLCALTALLFHTNGWTWSGAGQQILG